MSLHLTAIRARNFRSYEDFCLKPGESLTVLVGPNAVGKTNLIEAIQVLTTTESFRRPVWAELVKWGSPGASVEIEARGDGRELLLKMEVGAEGKRTFSVNGKVRRRLVDVAGIIPCVIFTPEDLRLIKDSAERRRAALDGVGTQLSQAFRELKAEYERVLRQRNALLKEETVNDGLLDPLTEQLISTGVRFVESRRRLFYRMEPSLRETYRRVAGEGPLEARYMTSWERDGIEVGTSGDEGAMRAHLKAKRDEERARRITLSGPHRDEIAFSLAGREARSFASQGQQRTIALSWKMSEVAAITEVSGQPPVLLLDDVMSELDEARRNALTDLVGRVAQTIVTTTNLGYFDPALIDRSLVVNL